MKNKTCMAKTLAALSLTALSFVYTSCDPKASKTGATGADSVAVESATPDSTIYGTCGDGTTMHALELVTDAGDTLRYIIADEEDGEQVQGGLMAGDRLAVIEGPVFDGEKQAHRVINLTTLQGKWTSLDKNFRIAEGGVVESDVKAENNPWTNWKILNGHLLLNKDTFEIDRLDEDSLYLENSQGIFVYSRLTTARAGK